MKEPDILDQLGRLWHCRRCNCGDCRAGFENHEHVCTDGPGCVETRGRLRSHAAAAAVIAQRAREEIRKLRNENRATNAGTERGSTEADLIIDTPEGQS